MKLSFAFLAVLLLVTPLAAGTHRAVAPPATDSGATADALGIGNMTGASIAGTVASVQGSVITLNSGTASPIRVDASAAKFASERDAAGSIADVKPGVRITAFVNTSAVLVVGAPLPAQMIVVDAQPDLAVAGTLQSVDVAGSRFNVLGITIATDANTSFGSDFPTFAPIKGVADLAVGQVVSVVAGFGTSGIVARRVQVISPYPQGTKMLRGVVKSIGATAWVITADGKDTTITVNAQTKILGDPKIGDSVQVMATVDSASNTVAIAIVKLDPIPPPKPTQAFTGTVKSIGAAAWVITTKEKDVTVAVTSATKIAGEPKVGDTVNVVATVDASGAYAALSIAKMGAPPPGTTVELRGTVKSIAATQWVIGGPMGTMSSTTPMAPDFIVAVNEKTVVYPGAKVGDRVVVAATRDATGGLTALKIALDK